MKIKELILLGGERIVNPGDGSSQLWLEEPTGFFSQAASWVIRRSCSGQILHLINLRYVVQIELL